MKLTKNSMVALLVSCFCFTLLPAGDNPVQGAEVTDDMKFGGSRIINITSDEMRLRTVTVESGTTVVWLNSSRRIMELTFTDKQVVTACGSPVNFFVNDAGSYSSNKIVPKATASLCFIEKGEYDYELVFRSVKGFGPGGSVKKDYKGKIVVK